MQLPRELREIAARTGADMSETEYRRRLAQASEVIEDFARSTAAPALHAALEAAGANPDQARTRKVRALAEEMTRQTAILQDEVSRFLSRRLGR